MSLPPRHKRHPGDRMRDKENHPDGSPSSELDSEIEVRQSMSPDTLYKVRSVVLNVNLWWKNSGSESYRLVGYYKAKFIEHKKGKAQAC